ACLSEMAEEAGYLIVISDADGVLLSIEGSGAVRRRAAEMMNFAEGVLWSEPGAGTNAIGTAIAADHAVQVFGPEHFNEPVQRWTCSAAPIHDPDTGEVLGVIDLTGDFSTVHPHSLAVATATAHAVAEPVSSSLEAFVVHAVETKRSPTGKPLLKLSLLGRDRALARLHGETTELRP